jgi:hypothetical protein
MSSLSTLKDGRYSWQAAWLIAPSLSAAIWLCSFGVTVWAYALTQGPYYPLPSIDYQIRLAAKISISTAILSFVSCIVPIIHARRMAFDRAFFTVAIGTELLLAIRALLCSQVIFDWNSQSNFVEQFISPSTLFAEYNWLTYIFEVGPVVSLLAALPQ